MKVVVNRDLGDENCYCAWVVNGDSIEYLEVYDD